MRSTRLLTVGASCALAVASSFLFASPAQAQVVAQGSLTSSNAYGVTKISMSGSTLTGYFTIRDTYVDGRCAHARIVYRTSSNGTVLTSSTGTSCTAGQTVQYSIPTTSNTSISKAVLEVWNGSGAKKTKTFGIG